MIRESLTAQILPPSAMTEREQALRERRLKSADPGLMTDQEFLLRRVRFAAEEAEARRNERATAAEKERLERIAEAFGPAFALSLWIKPRFWTWPRDCLAIRRVRTLAFDLLDLGTAPDPALAARVRAFLQADGPWVRRRDPRSALAVDRLWDVVAALSEGPAPVTYLTVSAWDARFDREFAADRVWKPEPWSETC